VPMTSRERLRRCYWHEELDRPGVYFRTSYPKDDPTYDPVRAYIEAHTERKITRSAAAFEPPPPVEHRTEPHSEDFDRVVTTLHTPAGDLMATRLESRHGKPGLHETFFIKGRADAETYLSLPLSEPSGDGETVREADRAAGDGGICQIQLGFNPAGHVAELCGSERFALLSVTDRDVLHALCERQMQVLLRRVAFCAAHGLGPYFGMLGEEYVVPPMHGPADFADFNMRYDRPILDAVHEAGGRMHVHCHGRLGAVLGQFVEAGVDVLHPVEPPPLGDITAAAAKEITRGRTTIEGNVQIADLYEASPAAVREQVERLIADAFDDRRGLIVSPSASLYVRGAGAQCMPRVQALVETVLRHGR